MCMRLGIQVRDKSSSLAFSRRETVRASSTPRGGRDDAALGAIFFTLQAPSSFPPAFTHCRSSFSKHTYSVVHTNSMLPSLKEFLDFSTNETYRRCHSQIMKQAWVQNIEVGKEAENEHTRKQEAYEE